MYVVRRPPNTTVVEGGLAGLVIHNLHRHGRVHFSLVALHVRVARLLHWPCALLAHRDIQAALVRSALVPALDAKRLSPASNPTVVVL